MTCPRCDSHKPSSMAHDYIYCSTPMAVRAVSAPPIPPSRSPVARCRLTRAASITAHTSSRVRSSASQSPTLGLMCVPNAISYARNQDPWSTRTA